MTRKMLLILLAVTGLASPAAAMTFTPNNASIAAKGAMNLTSRRSVSCAVRLQLATADRVGSITSASFAGYQCAAILPTGLPWRVSIDEGGFGGFHKLTIHGFALQFVHGATCGPADIRARLNPHGRIIFNAVGIQGTTPCSADVSVSTAPQLGIRGVQ